MTMAFKGAVFCALLLISGAGAAGACTRPGGIAEAQAQFQAWVNELRASRGLRGLRLNAELNAAAEAHSCDMAKGEFMDHKGSRGSTLKSRLRSAGYRFSTANENIARSSRAPSASVAGTLWQNSAGHLTNLLNPSITEMGFAIAVNGSMSYYTFVGGAPR